MKQSLKTYLSIILASVSLMACDSNRIYESNTEIEGSLWPKEVLLEHEFNIDKTDQLYNLSINVRNRNDYAYSNLFLFVEMRSPDEKYFSDTLEFKLADKTGRWTGSGIGNTWQNQFQLLQGVKILVPGKYKVIIRHGMREDTLKAISDVGIRVEKS